MILHSVLVENFKGIRGPVEVKFGQDAPNLLYGPNGAGKSTLLEAIEAALLDNYNTAGAAAEQMRTRGTAETPSVQVVFGHAGAVYRILKTFLDSPKAELQRRRADGTFETTAKGKQADEQLREMLRSQATKAKDRPGERMGLLAVLCGAQDIRRLPELSGEALADVRKMLGAQLSGTGGSAFEQNLQKFYLTSWTPGNKLKKGRLTELRAALDAARRAVAECEARIAQITGFETAARAERSRYDGIGATLAAVRADYGRLSEVAAEVSRLRTALEVANSRVKAAAAEYSRAKSELDRIIQTRAKRMLCEQEHGKLQETENGRKRERDHRAAEAQSAREAWDKATVPDPEIAAGERRVERALAFLHSSGELLTLEERLASVRRELSRKGEFEEELEKLHAPDDSTCTAIQKAAEEVKEARIRVEALSLRLSLSAEMDLPLEVVAGEPEGAKRLAQGETLIARAEGRLQVRLPGIATLELSGPSGDAAEWRSRYQAGSATLAGLMAGYGVQQWTELESLVQRRKALDSDLFEVRARLGAQLGKDTVERLEARQREFAARHDETLAGEPVWATQKPDVEELRRKLAEMKQVRELNQNETKKAWQDAESAKNKAEKELLTAASARAANDAALQDALRTLAELEADGRNVAGRQIDLDTKRRECDSAEEQSKLIAAELVKYPADAPERAAKVQETIKGLETDLAAAREAYKQNESAMRAILVQGPYASLATAEERVRQVGAQEEAESLRVEAVQRLWSSVQRAKESALAGLAGPVEQRATEILERIAGRPLAAIQLGDSLAPVAVQPDGSSADAAVDEMSSGEQEQIYFATRVALAEVVAKTERQTVVLDDPLVKTDGNRLARVLALVEEMSGSLQFIILTCHPERYEALPGLRLPMENGVVQMTRGASA